MDGAWVKFFTDGTQERGSDADISRGSASWTRGRLDSIEEVSITEGRISCKLKVADTEWFQFDRLAAPMAPGVHRPCRTHRVIQAKIKDHHVGLSVEGLQDGPQRRWYWLDNKSFGATVMKIALTDVGKWITAIIPSRGIPYVVISERGKIREKDSK